MASGKTIAITALLATTLIAGGVALRVFVFADDGPGSAADGGPVPVEVAAVEHGPIERRRELTGSLEASAEFIVAPKVAGRVVRVAVDLADTVTRGQVVAELDDQELQQAEAQARANLAVARAQASAAEKAVTIARRNFDRVSGLHGRSIASEQELDVARSEKAEAEGNLEVARAEVQRASAEHQAAKIRSSYAKVTAEWTEGDDQRVVAARYADEGSTLAANAPLLSIVDLDPVVVVVHVTESDYAELAPGIPVTVRTDAFPGESFAGQISRVAPVFRAASRQARVEMTVPNGDGRLKPGMFVRVRAVLERLEDATIVPAAALVERDGQTVVFVLPADGSTVEARPVDVGIREGERVAITAKDNRAIAGRVVVLGQQQLVDGTAIVIPEYGRGAAP
ncbi:MAG TPA: efflux RND transporter periplasmic adaptor subunit [Enhygromyxa sp.]|nr:efflux RND transporter periplasmic adaptor subunit [Enhygromyxa sp.]